MTKEISIAIVGLGNIGEWVLSKLCYEILNKNLHVSKIVCIGNNIKRLESKISDLIQSLFTLDSQYDKKSICKIVDNLQYSVKFDQMKDIDYAITAYGAPMDQAVKSRSDLLYLNDVLTQDVANKILKFIPNHCRIINIANPLDVITWRLQYLTNFPVNQIIGISGQVDKVRLAQGIKEIAGFDYSSIDLSSLIVLGEHGPSAVPILSRAKINHQYMFEILDNETIDKIKSYSIQKGTQMMQTNNRVPPHITVAQATINCLKSWVSRSKTKICISSWNPTFNAYLGSEVYISDNGITPTKLYSQLTQEERLALNASADIITHDFLKLNDMKLTMPKELTLTNQ